MFLKTIASLLLLLKECKCAFIIFRYDFIICQGGAGDGLLRLK